MGAGSHGDIVKTLPAGAVSVPIQAAGDFVFLREAAFPVRVMINGDPVTMEAGEKRRLDRPFDKPGQPAFSGFEVDNLATVAQRVTFVVGQGDYEKIIVSGSLNVSEYVSTATMGEAKSLPFELAKTVGLLNTTENNYAINDVALTSGAFGVGKLCPVYWDGEIIGVGRDNLYRWDESTADTTWKSTAAIDTTLTAAVFNATDVLGACVDEFGQIYYCDNARNLFTVSANGGAARVVNEAMAAEPDEPTGHTGSQFIYRGGYIYYLHLPNVIKMDKFGNFVEKYHYQTDLNWPGTKADIGIFNGDIVAYSTSSSTAHYLLDDNFKFVQSVSGSVYLGSAWCDVPGGRRVAVATNTDLEFREVSTRTEYGAVYVQDGSDTATRKFIYLDAPPRVFGRANGNSGLWDDNIARILQVAADKVDPNYLDYVTAIEFNDGNVVRKVGSGTESFSLRGIPDVFPVMHESAVTITLLPEFFE